MPVATTMTVRDGNNAAQTIPALADLAGNLSPMNTLDSGQRGNCSLGRPCARPGQ